MLSTCLDGVQVSELADLALESQNNLLRGLRLLLEDGLGLTTESGLLTIVTTLSCSVTVARMPWKFKIALE